MSGAVIGLHVIVEAEGLLALGRGAERQTLLDGAERGWSEPTSRSFEW